jgi:hypothetical protein
MKKYFIYKMTVEGLTFKKYSETKLPINKHCTFIGEGTFTEDYFKHFESVYSEFVDLADVELTYEAKLTNGNTSTFVHNLRDLLIKAKDGILPYISFAEYKVNINPRITINRNNIISNPI